MPYDHTPVLQTTTINAWFNKPNGLYIDGTFGRGGHTKLLLEKLDKNGKILVIDRDLEAISNAQKLSKIDPRVQLSHDSFNNMHNICPKDWHGKVDGILLDLGVSSPQLDDPKRGFSFNKNGPLDMRMDNSQGITAASWLASATYEEISKVLCELGEERFHKRIAKAIVKNKDNIKTTTDLTVLIQEAAPMLKKQKKHPSTRTFQAIRMHINNELTQLKTTLPIAVPLLGKLGKLVVISFHSGEDRFAKKFMQGLANPYANLPNKLPIPDYLKNLPEFQHKKYKPTPIEILANVRSRSAILRVLKKL